MASAIKTAFLSLVMSILILSECMGQAITDFTPQSVSAGTETVLTINGSGFGSGPASSTRYAEFKSADDGGASYIRPDLSEYVSWSDNQILVKVPSGAGTGNIRVTNGASSNVSSGQLAVKFNILNEEEKPYKLVNRDGSGGYTFQFENNFSADPAAKNSFLLAFNSWRCATNVNWSIGQNTTVNVTANDETNVVRFAVGDELDAGALGVAYSFFTNCGNGQWELKGVDVVFDNAANTNWNYDTALPSNSQSDFQSVALHELGHAHGLGHVNDGTDVMNFSIGNGVSRRTLNASNIEAGNLNMTFSSTSVTGSCYPAMTASASQCNTVLPTVTSFSPLSGYSGQTITITGTGFTGVSGISFGGVAAASFTVVSGTTITAVISTGATGAVAVTTSGGVGTLDGFTFNVDPRIDSFTPASAIAGQTVTISGDNLSTVTAVSFGGVPASSFVVSAKTIAAKVANGSSGRVSVVSPRGTLTLPGFTFISPPEITSFTPQSAAKGDTVTIIGSGFSTVNEIRFGGVNAASFTITSSGSIRAVLGSAATGSVTLKNTAGSAEKTGFTFIPPPAISSYTTVRSGNESLVTILGANFIGASSVSFGGVDAASFSVISSEKIEAFVGEGDSGDIVVKTPGGTAAISNFVFTPILRIKSFTPAIAAKGTTVTITGSAFTDVTNVNFGSSPAASFTVISANTIKAVVGTGLTGNVSVTTALGIAELPGFIFALPPTISSFTPSKAGIGTTMIISGTNLLGSSAVSFGGVAAASFTVLSSTTIMAIPARGSSGVISVTTPAATVTAAGFVFLPAPTIDSFSPAAAGVGTIVTVSGSNLDGVTFVSVGGERASFTQVSSNTITVVVPPGASSGSISVTTGGGTANRDGFIFVDPPVISSFSPSTAIGGVTVEIKGQNFFAVSAVSFGGKPAASFTVNSTASISAVVAPESAPGDVSVTAAGGIGVLKGFNYVFSLPSNNFKVSKTDELCKSGNNGTISISAARSLNYTATITGNNSTRVYQFTNTLQVKEYNAGSYTMCITVDGQNSYKQCFDIVISEPKDLELYSTVKDRNIVNLVMNGAEVYHVEVNGILYTTSENQMTLTLPKGDNIVKVSTDKLCQGVIEKQFNIPDEILVYPNPFENLLNIKIDGSHSGSAKVEVRNLTGSLVHSRQYEIKNGVVQLDLSTLKSGLYILRLTIDNSDTVYKVIKN